MDAKTILLKLERFLPPHEVIHKEVESILLGSTSASVAGIAVAFDENDIVFGSSLSFQKDALELAGYELLERFVLTRNRKHPERGTETIYSVSNGVAIHREKHFAEEAAKLELIERNEVLRSWYLNSPIRRVLSEDFLSWFSFLDSKYEVQIYDFSNYPDASVVGIFAFPLDRSLPFLSGYGAGRTLVSALEKSKKEFCARYSFLEDVDLNEAVVFSPDAEFHQNYYLQPDKAEIISSWLKDSSQSETNPRAFLAREITYQNLTPESWASDFHLSKALSNDVIPLFFGKLPAKTFKFTHRCDIPHPIY